MVEVKVTCDRCKRQIKDPTEEGFFHITIREKTAKPDGAIFTIDQYDMILCEDCMTMITDKEAEDQKKAAVPEVAPVQLPPEIPKRKKKKAAVQEEKKAAAPEEKKAAVQEEEKAAAPGPVEGPGVKRAPRLGTERKPRGGGKVDKDLVKVLINQGRTQAKIAKEMGVTPGAISQIVKRYIDMEEGK